MIMVDFDTSSPSFHRSTQYPRQTHRGSPHLQHLDHHHPSAHSTPSPPCQYASLPTQQQQQLQQGPPPSRSTPTSYPSPAYPSPSMSAYHSPYSQPMQVPSLNLPPIRLNPPTASPPTQLSLPPPPQQQGRVGSPLMGSPLPQPPQHGFYSQHGLPPPGHHPNHITSSPHLSPRYPLPSAGGGSDRIMSGGRHKKEIKRRTKTGCLTCRKRRIKCDEEHPSCKNCAKSKRDCMGYDPIFKPQPGPTSQQPAAIQPAPAPGGFIPHSLAPVYYTSSYAVSNSSVGGHSYAQTNSTAASSPTSSETYDYAPIDPTLETASLVNPPNSASGLLESQPVYRPNLKRPLDRDSPFSSASDTTRVTPIPRSTTPSQARVHDNPAKRIKIDDLLSGGSSSSQPLTPPSSEAAPYANPSNTVENMKTLYKSRYAPALDEFLETGWFMNRGLVKIRSDAQLVEVMTEIFERLKARGGSFVDEEDPSIGRQGKTAGILWAGVKMCYGTSIPAADNRQDEDEDEFRDDKDGAETLHRINVVEALVTGQPLEPVPSSPRRLPVDRTADNATLFWKLLGRIATARAGEQIDSVLKDCKQLVEGKDTRKLLYTIAEARHVGKRPYDAAEDPTVSKGSKELLGELRRYIETVATSHAEPTTPLNRRIAGRAVAQWREAITDTQFLC